MLKKIVTTILLIVFFYLPTASLAAKDKSKTKIPPVFVETITVKTSSYLDKISSTGTLISIPGITIKPEISGRITKIYFKSGNIVQKDTILVEINPNIAKAALEAAEAELELNRLNFERSSLLYKTKDISQSDFDKAKTNFRLAKAKVDNAKALLEQTIIRAPFSGKLGLSQVNEGDFVNVGQNIVNLQTLDPLKVDFSIPEAYQSKVAINQTVSLKSDAYPKEKFIGKVEAIESLINPKTRTLNIRANVPNKKGKLIPGGFAEVTLEFAKKRSIMIPQTSVVYSAEGNYIFKVVGGRAVKTSVELGKKDSENVIVKSGLKTGDVVVTSGQMKIQEGSPVMVVKEEKTQTK